MNGLDPKRKISLAELDAQTVFAVRSYLWTDFSPKKIKKVFKPSIWWLQYDGTEKTRNKYLELKECDIEKLSSDF